MKIKILIFSMTLILMISIALNVKLYFNDRNLTHILVVEYQNELVNAGKNAEMTLNGTEKHENSFWGTNKVLAKAHLLGGLIRLKSERFHEEEAYLRIPYEMNSILSKGYNKNYEDEITWNLIRIYSEHIKNLNLNQLKDPKVVKQTYNSIHDEIKNLGTLDPVS